MNKVSVKPSQIDIPSSFLENIAETNTIEMAGKEYTDGEEVKNDMGKIIFEKGANLDDAINEEAKQFQNRQMANKK